MVNQWFFQTADGQPAGPVNSKELRRLAELGVVKPNTLIRKGESGRWVSAENAWGLYKQTAPLLTASQVAPPTLHTQGTNRHTTESSQPSPTSADTKFTASSESGISDKTNECKGHLIQLGVCFGLLAGVFFYGFLLDAAGEVSEFFVRVLSFSILIFGGGMLLATFRLFRNGWQATWKAARMVWDELLGLDQTSASGEVQPTEMGEVVSDPVSEKMSIETHLSTSVPRLTRPLMWHAGRLFARSRDACTTRPKVLVVGACIATASLLMITKVIMSRGDKESQQPAEVPLSMIDSQSIPAWIADTESAVQPEQHPPQSTSMPPVSQQQDKPDFKSATETGNVEIQDLAAALDRGSVTLEAASGNGASSGLAVDAYLVNQRNIKVLLDISLTQPLFLRNRGRGQNMLVIKVYLPGGGYRSKGFRSFISLQPKRRTQVQFLAYCADFEKDNPSATEEFDRDVPPVSLLPVLHSISNYNLFHPNQDVTTEAQTAIWLAQGVSIEAVRAKFEVTRSQEQLAREFLK